MNVTAGLVPRISLEAAAARTPELADTGVTRFDDVLDAATAATLQHYLRDELCWDTTISQGGKAWDASADQQRAIGEQRLSGMALVGQGLRFHFDVVRTANSPESRLARGWLLDRLAEAWSAPECLRIWQTLLGRDDIRGLELMASRYRPGHFLSTHDDGQTPERVAAFVLTLSGRWSADWGGLLHFIGEDGDVERTVVPRWNTLSVFRVPRAHCVSMVSPLAREPRLSITGWFLGDAA